MFVIFISIKCNSVKVSVKLPQKKHNQLISPDFYKISEAQEIPLGAIQESATEVDKDEKYGRQSLTSCLKVVKLPESNFPRPR